MHTVSTCVVDKALSDLDLDELNSIGYTYKCLSCALTALRQHHRLMQSGTMSPEECFQRVISDVVSQGGDADTNAAVSGALLGCYCGYSRLPQKWVSKMPYVMWLDAWVQKLMFMMKCE